MDKESLLKNLIRAKAAHIKWRSYAYALVSGLDIQSEYTPVKNTECSFGKWYYSDDSQEVLNHFNTFHGIAAPHKILHDLYDKIFQLVQKKKLKQAEELIPKLEALSNQLLESIDLLEKEIKDNA